MESAKHSGIGIASFVTGITFCLLTFISVVAADLVAASMPGGIDEQSAAGIVLALSLAGSLVALRLGVGGISQEARKKGFAILGIVFSAATILGIGLIMAVGLAPK